MSSDDGDDYMSDKFSSEKVPDVRPGLVFSQKRKREIEMGSKKARIDEDHRKKYTPRVQQQEQLQKGLANAIPKSNIGFSLLAKMGYREGTSLGKSNTGIMEPIGITVKADRKGLGREAAVKQIRERQQQLALEKMRRKSGTSSEFDPNEFRMRMVRKSQLKQVEGDLARCQRACERLDLEMQFEEPTIVWFWPEKPKEEEEEGEDGEEGVDDEEQYEPHEKLELVNDYLRTTHLYCNWCGTKYDSDEDMQTNCPGTTRDDH